MIKTLLCALALSLALGACPALAETYVQPGVFSVSSPDGWPIADYLLMNECAPCVTVEMAYHADRAEFNLFSADPDAFQAYTSALLSRFYALGGEYLGVLYSRDSNIPFVVLRATDASGTFYYAETMARGWAIGLRCYAYNDATFTAYRALTGDEYRLFEQMIVSFSPIR